MNRFVKTLIIIVYIIFLVAVIVFYSGLYVVDDFCGFYSDDVFYRKVLIFVISPLIGYLFALVLKVGKKSRSYFYGLIPLMIFICAFLIDYRLKPQRTFSQTCIVRKAIIYKTFSGKNRQRVTVKFSDETYNYQWELRLIKYSANKLQEGDSLLIMYAKDCDVLREVYKPKPTITEFEKCTDYGYYYNGKLYSKGEFEAINQ